MDARAFLGSVTGEMADAFGKEFQNVPDGIMPGGFRNGEMFRAKGYRIVEETPLPDDEVCLKVFLEGSRHVIQPVFKRVGEEWKWAHN
jgi:hypothetical protein